MQIFRFIGAMVSVFCHGFGLHYNVLSGHIISYFKRSKRVNKQIICLCTSSEENRFTCKISGSYVLWLVSFASSKEEEEAILK